MKGPSPSWSDLQRHLSSFVMERTLQCPSTDSSLLPVIWVLSLRRVPPLFPRIHCRPHRRLCLPTLDPWPFPRSWSRVPRPRFLCRPQLWIQKNGPFLRVPAAALALWSAWELTLKKHLLFFPAEERRTGPTLIVFFLRVFLRPSFVAFCTPLLYCLRFFFRRIS